MTFIVFALTACSKTTVVLLESGKSQNAILVSNEAGETKIDKVGDYVDLTDEKKKASQVKSMSKKELEARFSKVLAIVPEEPISYILYFKPNSTELTTASESTFKEALNSIKARSPCMVDIIGHTDTVGSHEANRKVSLNRANRIKEIIQNKEMKVSSLVAKGYGEEDLLVQTQNNKAEAKNRNVEIFIK
ncbi:MAG: Unknown protein [uncultured Sulfurovum sp.]|uniref:OmpA-like domain-containing protein n=1 Tax=uncultured Sulfurovum sp. TaxID=269237 RepID=A0A6S6SZJ2_9BACT|nr:MAG: Unknown protein [uncultured Sulfurovum sp.]